MSLRKVTYGGATSLDGYLARADDTVDWLLWSNEASAVMTEYWKTIDTVLMGRKTFEKSRRMGGSSGYPGVTTYVFSRTLKHEPDRNVAIVSEDAADFVRQLKDQPGKDICLMGGGELENSLFEADLIDDVGFKHPSYAPRFRLPAFHLMRRQLDLELVTSRVFKNGCVLVTYRVKRGAQE